MFRGREVTHPERGVMILDRLAEDLKELCTVEQRPIQDGRNMTMLLGPSKAVLAGTLEEDAAAREAEAAAAAALDAEMNEPAPASDSTDAPVAADTATAGPADEAPPEPARDETATEEPIEDDTAADADAVRAEVDETA